MTRISYFFEKYAKWFSLVITLLAGIMSALMSFWIGSGPGHLLISSNPTGAQITINGMSYGNTPNDIKLDPGTYKIAISKSGYQISEKVVKLSSKKSYPISMSLLQAIQTPDLDDLSKRFDDLKSKLNDIEIQTAKLSKPDLLKTATLAKDIQAIKDELKGIKKSIYDNPEKALTLPLINKELELLKETNIRIRSEVNRVYDLSKWFIGTLIAMTVGLLGAIVSIIVSKK